MKVSVNADIAVLMPVYNPGDELLNTIDSIKKNKIPHHIFIVDDGSKTPVLEQFIQLDCPQITVITMDDNVGITKSLNRGLSIILQQNYQYIARMDSGDLCNVDRFEKQINYLENNKNIAVVGSQAKIINNDGDILFKLQHPLDYSDIIHKLYYNSAFLHPSLMIRSQVFRDIGLYDEKYIVAQDYELMRRISQKYHMANLSESLIEYVVDDNSLSIKKRKLQVLNRIKIQIKYFNYGNIHSYLGVIKSSMLYFLPVSFLTWVKSMLN